MPAAARSKLCSSVSALRPPLHFDAVAIEKEAFWSPSTVVTNTFYLFLVRNYCIFVMMSILCSAAVAVSLSN